MVFNARDETCPFVLRIFSFDLECNIFKDIKVPFAVENKQLDAIPLDSVRKDSLLDRSRLFFYIFIFIFIFIFIYLFSKCTR